MERAIKCKDCGQIVEVSREGWTVDSVVRDQRRNVVLVNGLPKREVKYFEWIHLVGHARGNKHCPGSGTSPVEHQRKAHTEALPA